MNKFLTSTAIFMAYTVSAALASSILAWAAGYDFVPALGVSLVAFSAAMFVSFFVGEEMGR